MTAEARGTSWREPHLWIALVVPWLLSIAYRQGAGAIDRPTSQTDVAALWMTAIAPQQAPCDGAPSWRGFPSWP